jgi:hypothetical protein
LRHFWGLDVTLFSRGVGTGGAQGPRAQKCPFLWWKVPFFYKLFCPKTCNFGMVCRQHFRGKIFYVPFSISKSAPGRRCPPPIVWCFLCPCCLERTRRCMLHACSSIIYVVTKRYLILMIFCLTCSVAFADRQLYVLCCMWQHMWGVLGRNDGRRKTNDDHFCQNGNRISKVEVR